MTENYFEIKQHESWLYSIKDRMNVYCWLVVGDGAALLLDTGYGFGDLPAAVRRLTGKPLTVVLSHGHADHALGADRFERVLLHRADFDLLKEYCGSDWRQKAIDALKSDCEKSGRSAGDFDFDEYLNRSAADPAELEEGAEFDLGGLTVRVVPMPGHTPGSAGLYIPEHKTLLTGDSANRATFMFLPESLPIAEYLEMLQKTIKLDFETHYVGHQDTAYTRKWFEKYIKVAKNALADKGKPMKIPGFEEHGEILVSSVGGPVLSPAFCAVAYTEEKLRKCFKRLSF